VGDGGLSIAVGFKRRRTDDRGRIGFWLVGVEPSFEGVLTMSVASTFDRYIGRQAVVALNSVTLAYFNYLKGYWSSRQALLNIQSFTFEIKLLTMPLTEPCLRYLRTRLLDNTLHVKGIN